MSAGFRFLIGALWLSLTTLWAQDVVFSRRIYKEQGPTYQQIWTWNPANAVLKQLTHSSRDHYRPACKDRGITFVSGNSSLWTFNPATGEERAIGPAPAAPLRELPRNDCVTSGALEACRRNEADLVLSRAGKQIGKFHIQANDCRPTRCGTPILSLDWSPDGKRLLVGGLADLHETYYFLVDAVSMKIHEIATAFPQSMLWIPGRDELLYATPDNIAPLGGPGRKRDVWVRHLMLLDAATGTTRAITSGLSHNVDAALCNK